MGAGEFREPPLYIRLFDHPTAEVELVPRMHVKEPGGQPEPDGTYVLTMKQPAGPGALVVVARLSQFMHVAMTAEPSDAGDDPALPSRVSPIRSLDFTLVITGQITQDGFDVMVRE